MKKSISLSIIFVLLLFFLFTSLSNAGNPFTTNQENKQTSSPAIAPQSVILNTIFVKIIVWQQYLKEKMTLLIRQAKADGSITPIWFLILTAFSYGVIHAAGPGHGKAIALSYVLAQRPSYIQGLLFSNFIALFHGLSGIVFVLFIRFILNTSMMDNLDQVTNITQVASYSIIACLGAIIFLYSIYKIVKNKDETQRNGSKTLN
ncbi:MAG: hypothetical protein KAJ62_12375, partial [Desulfobacteraceae bacterium]|nr:hypothetical protein [Desulfobacteraceae bacterium]